MTTAGDQSLIDRVRSALSEHYSDIEAIGEGGMARVFRGRSLESGEFLAIKVFRPELHSAINEARFLQESEISGAFEHPNIVPVLESGVVDGLLYLTMPYVKGGTLRERLTRDGPLGVDEALCVISEVGAGLACAHEAGFLHRDIKPSNIILATSGAVLADFGVAKALQVAGGDRLTKTGFSVGTPTYMSPEQGRGRAEPDVRSDQYSLACVLYETLIGEPPFTGRDPRVVIARHIRQPPPSLSVARPELPAGVVDAINRALAKTPADRFERLPDFIEALESASPATGGPHDLAERAVGEEFSLPP